MREPGRIESSADIVVSTATPVHGASAPPPSADAAPPARRSNTGCLLAGLGCLLLPVLLVGVLFAGGYLTLTSLTDTVRIGLDQLSPPQRATISQAPAIIRGIQPLGQLVSVSVQLAEADIQVGVTAGALNECGFSASHVAVGSIEAGIDLTQVTEDDVRYDEATNTYFIALPPPQLTRCSVDYTRQYERSTTLCAVDWDSARILAQYEALNDFRDQALEGGVLTRAQTEAEIALTNFIQAVTGANVALSFSAAPAATGAPNATPQPTMARECRPDSPEGWTYDPSSDQWSRP